MSVLNPMPPLTRPDSANVDLPYPVLFSNRGLSSATIFKSFYFACLGFGYFAKVAFFSTVNFWVLFRPCPELYDVFISAFGAGIFLIRGIISKKQVFGSNTPTIVTLVKHPHILWNSPVGNFPRKSVRRNMTAEDIKSSVSFASSGASCPHPATSNLRNMCWNGPLFINFRPKLIFNLIDSFIQKGNRLGRFFHSSIMTELSRFWCSFTSDGVFIVSKSGLIATRKWGGLSRF